MQSGIGGDGPGSLPSGGSRRSSVSVAASETSDNALVKQVHQVRDVVSTAGRWCDILLHTPKSEGGVRAASHALSNHGFSEVAEKLEALRRLEHDVFGDVVTPEVLAPLDACGVVELVARLRSSYFELLESIPSDTARYILCSRPAHSDKPIDNISKLIKLLATIYQRRALEHRPAVIQENLARAREKTRNAERDIALLRDELTRKHKLYERQRLELQALLEAVRKDLDYVTTGAHQAREKLDITLQTTTTDTAVAHHGNVNDLKLSLSNLQAELQKLQANSKELSRLAHQKSDRARVAAEEVVATYDNDMKAKYVELDAFRAETIHNAKVIQGFEEYFAKVDAERTKVQEYERQMAEWQAEREAAKAAIVRWDFSNGPPPEEPPAVTAP